MGTRDCEVVLRAAAGRVFGEETVGADGRPFVRLSPLGLVVSEHIDKIGYFEPGVEVTEKEVTADSVRFALRCGRPMRKPLDEIVRGFKVGCFKIAREYGLVRTGDAMPIFDRSDK